MRLSARCLISLSRSALVLGALRSSNGPLTDRFKTRLDERLAENERKQAEKQAEPDMEETWDLSDPADPLNIGMGWGTGGHGLGL